MKVAVIGGGSTYTPELVNGFLDRSPEFPLKELWLVDIDEQRLEIVGGFAQRMVQAKGTPFSVILSANQREAIADAHYVTTQLRVGQMPARREDEYLGQKHGLIKWAGNELGELANAVIRQLNFQSLEFEVVLVGSMFAGGQLLIEPMRERITQLAPGARLIKLKVPPVVGALLIGMQAGGLQPTPEIRENLVNSIS